MIVEGKTENMLTKLAQIQMISVDFMTSSSNNNLSVFIM